MAVLGVYGAVNQTSAVSAPTEGASFFRAQQAALVQGLVQRGRQDVQRRADLRHPLALIQPPLRFAQPINTV